MNYVGSNMACVVCSTQSLDVLQKLTENALQDVKRADRPYPRLYILGRPFTKDTDAYVLASLQSQRELSVQWVLPYSRTSPDNAFADRIQKRYFRDDLFLSHILGHEGPDSILADLRRRGLATGLGRGFGEDTDQFRTFDVSVQLTQKGLKEWRKVLATIRGAALGLQTVEWPANCFEETARMARLGFQCGAVSGYRRVDGVMICTQVGRDARRGEPRDGARRQVASRGLGRFGRFAGFIGSRSDAARRVHG